MAQCFASLVVDTPDYDSLMETLRVYQNQYLRNKVQRSMEQIREGAAVQHDITGN